MNYSPTSSHNRSEKVFNNRGRGDIIHPPNGTITSKKSQPDTPDANYKSKESVSPKNVDCPAIDYNMYNDDDGINGIKTEEVLIDTKRSETNKLVKKPKDIENQENKPDPDKKNDQPPSIFNNPKVVAAALGTLGLASIGTTIGIY